MLTRTSELNSSRIFQPRPWAIALGLCLGTATGPALAQATHTPPAGYKPCAVEGQKCSFSGAANVVYGAGTTWTSPRSFTNGVSCSNATFGDPLWGVQKACYAGAPSPAPAPDPVLTAPPPGYTLCAVEGQQCSFTGTAKVVYGAGTTWTAARAFTNNVMCNNATFGDPLRQVKKACYVSSPVPTPAPPAPPPTPPAPPAPPAPPPAPTPGGSVTYYFSDCQAGAATGCVPGSNSNPGTQAAPKQNLTGINVNTLPAGTALLFARGGAWVVGVTTFENMNVRADAPLTFDAYGAGPAPLLNTNNNAIAPFELGGRYANTSNDGGYVFRNLRIHGSNNSAWGFWLSGNVRDIVIENVEISGFQIAIHSQARAPHGVNNVLIRNNHIHHNGSMGILGQFRNSVIEGNLIEANNFSGSGFNHGTYLSGSHGLSGTNVTLRNNRYIRNSVVNGICQGGNMTFHGQMDGVLIEGNRIEQDAATDGCWEMSITQGYDSAEWFRNFVVRNNTLINAGNTGMAVQSAPGIVIEGNVIINTQTTFQTAINVGHTEFQNGDVPDGNAVVRNNIACFPTPHAGSTVVRVIAPNSVVTNNTMVTGAAATAGVCAR
ncbi:right-handed parallel beta-helix repeat-containing protein [Acidovorax sp. SD340]|uniref:Right-handed parallel beta-helix repeat-containing protein n=2 Tax=Acidovorax facilis TaxID=12917 RepID=A0ABV8D6T2_9BURK|nr:right-handed parallel beta-helix repeat-containing protein [Acidovorax sp. SD340]MBO1009134.1 right-handed parallel beta-helix repeat-containing protein [Acidovorax sp. SD340]